MDKDEIPSEYKALADELGGIITSEIDEISGEFFDRYNYENVTKNEKIQILEMPVTKKT